MANQAKPGAKNGSSFKITFWQAVLVAIITTTGGIVTTYISVRNGGKDKKAQSTPTVNVFNNVVVPPQQTQIASKFAKGDDTSAFSLTQDVSVFDLRAWRPVPRNPDGSVVQARVSPVNYINYLHIQKIKEASYFYAEFSTSGYAIDLRCITHNADPPQQIPANRNQPQNNYLLKIDVSREPVNKEFMIVIEGTYWNGFKDSADYAETYADKDAKDLEDLSLFILFPQNKPFTKLIKYEINEPDTVPHEYRGLESFFQPSDGQCVYWSIRKPKPYSDYQLEWNW